MSAASRNAPGCTILERRLRAGLSQAALGKLCGVSKHAVSHWEHGTARPRAEHRATLAHALGGAPADYDIEFEPTNDAPPPVRGPASPGRIITARRLWSGVSIRQLARYCEVSLETVRGWEEDDIGPPADQHQALADLLGGIPDDFTRTSTSGSRIRAGREANGVTVESIAEAVGVSTKEFERWEADEALPTPEQRLAMIRILFKGPRVTLADSAVGELITAPDASKENDA